MALKNQLILLPAIFVVISALLLQSAQSLDLEGAKEQSCFEVFKTVKTDLQWLMSVKKWYYSLGSRFELYTFASILADKNPKDVNEYDLYYKSCVNWQFRPDGTLVSTGFGKEKSINFKPLDKNFGIVEFSPKDGDGGEPVTTHITLTDNKSFIFYVTCYSGANQMVWTAASPYKSLPKETVKLIYDHAKSHGFKEEYFTGLRYDSCDKDGKDEQKEKNEL